MAITKLIRIKERSHGDPGMGLRDSLRYICNPEKAAIVGGNAGAGPDASYQVMKRNKEYWSKTGGSQGFHYIISFPPDCHVDAKTAAAVAEEFTEELLDGRHYYTYAVHNDRSHMHVHIVFDSVSAQDGAMFHSPKGDWEKRSQPIADRVCRRHGLPELGFGETRTGVDYGEWKLRKERETEERRQHQKDRSRAKASGADQGEFHADEWYRFHGSGRSRNEKDPYPRNWFDLMRDDIDEAILHSPTYSEFLKYLQSLDYTVRDGKYLSLKPKERERAIRTLRLGRGYGKEEIQQRIEYVRTHPFDEKDFRIYGEKETVSRLLFVRVRTFGKWRMNAFQRQFFQRWRNTCLIRRPDFRAVRGSRGAVMRLEELSQNLQYLIKEDIRSPEDLAKKRADLGNERKAVQSELSSVRTKLYKNRVCRLVMRMDELESLPDPDGAAKEELQQVKEEIEQIGPVDQATAYRAQLVWQQDRCLSQRRDIRRRDRLLDGIGQELREEATQGYSDVQLDEMQKRRALAERRRREWMEKKQTQAVPLKGRREEQYERSKS